MDNLCLKGTTAVLALSLLVGLAAAEEGQRRADPAPREGRATAVQAMAESLADQVDHLIGDLPRPRMDLVVASSCELPQRRERPALSVLLEELLTSQISRHQPLRTVRRRNDWPNAARARGGAGRAGFELLVWFTCRVEANHLVLEGMVYNTEHHVWRELVEAERLVIGHIFVRRRINAELRWHLPALPAGPLTMSRYPLGEDLYLALAVADLDGDGLEELALLTRRSLEVRRLGPRNTPLLTKLSLEKLPPAATTTRDPQGTLVVGPADDKGARPLALRTSDHGEGLLVGYDLEVLREQGRLSDFPLRWNDELHCGSLPPGDSAFASAPQPCGTLGGATDVPAYHGTAQAVVAQPSGREDRVAATARTDGTVVFEWNETPLGVISSVGTALGLADLNDDGLVEVLLSSDNDPAQGDRLYVARLGAEGLEPTRETVADVAGSVWVGAGGDGDNDGLPELLAIEQGPQAAHLLVIGGASP